MIRKQIKEIDIWGLDESPMKDEHKKATGNDGIKM